MRLDGYIRVSDVRGRTGETFISPDVQREKIEGYAALHGHTVAQVWTELDESGGTTDRPLFQRAIARVERGTVDGIIVAKLDRFARTLAGALETLRRIEAAGGKLVSVDDQFDTSTPIGRFAVQIMLALAELEHARIRDNWQTAQRRAVSRGVHITPRVPVGYRRGAGGVLEPHPVTADAVRDAFRLRAAGGSGTQVARLLNDAGVETSYGGRWTAETARRLLTNRVYLGEARGSGDIAAADAHEPLVTAETFAAAAAQTRAAQPVRGHALLSGILRCAGCRYTMSRAASNGRYRCKTEHSVGRCPSPAAVVDRIVEEHVVAEFLAHLADGGPRAHIAPAGVFLEPLRLAADTADQELAAWRDDTEILALGRDLYLDGLQARSRRRDEAHRALQDVIADISPADDVLAHAVGLADAWPTLDVLEQRELLAAAIDVVFLRRGRNIPITDRTVILWRGQGPTDLPRRAKPSPIRGFVGPDDGHVAARMPPAQ